MLAGLFVGEQRLKVKTGPNDGDNRINDNGTDVTGAFGTFATR